MYTHKMWKRKSRSVENTEAMSLEFQKIHNHVAEVNTPRVGGVVVWLSVLATLILAYLAQYIAIAFIDTNHLITHDILDRLNFLSLNQTVLLVIALFAGSILVL